MDGKILFQDENLNVIAFLRFEVEIVSLKFIQQKIKPCLNYGWLLKLLSICYINQLH